jgi:hypothetical protein
MNISKSITQEKLNVMFPKLYLRLNYSVTSIIINHDICHLTLS